MANCEFLDTCIFFNDNMPNMPNTAKLLKTTYCRGGFARCARYRVAAKLGRPQVPKDLYPDQEALAEALIEKFLAH